VRSKSGAIRQIRTVRPSASSQEVTDTDIDYPKRPLAWPGFLAVTTVLVATATVLLHLLGMEVHRTYLAAWNINSTQFPKSTDWLLLNGYHGVWNGIAMLFLAMVQNFHWWVAGAITFVFYVWLLTSAWNPFSDLGEKFSWIQNLPNWLRRLGLLISVGTLMSALLVPITLALFILIGIPAQTGSAIGEKIFESHYKQISKGCAVSKSRCIQILKNGTPHSSGFVLDVSATHLAYFDTGLLRARAIPLEGIEIRAMHLPQLPNDPPN
jgi:hypothetical protein